MPSEISLALAIAGLLCHGLFGGKRPNFLFIIVDDQSPLDLKIYNPRSILDTPNLDRLAKEGMVLDGAYHMGARVGESARLRPHGDVRTHGLARPGQAGSRHEPARYQPQESSARSGSIYFAGSLQPGRLRHHATCKNGNSYEAANKLFTVCNDGTRRGGTDETGSHWHGEQVMNYLKEPEASKDKDPFLVYYGFSHPHDGAMANPSWASYGAVNHLDQENLPRQPKATALAHRLVTRASFRPRTYHGA